MFIHYGRTKQDDGHLLEHERMEALRRCLDQLRAIALALVRARPGLYGVDAIPAQAVGGHRRPHLSLRR